MLGGSIVVLCVILLVQAVPHHDYEERLMLTPLIESNEIAKAKSLAFVNLKDFKNIDSYSGYITVDKGYNSNLFFWYVRARNHSIKTPLILHLEGGPGATSLFGLFGVNGPFKVANETHLKRSGFDWTELYSIIYVDNPVGAGFSFTNSSLGYSKNQEDVGRNLYVFLMQFFQLFPELLPNDFYIEGSSYGVKYTAAIAHIIHTNNPKSKIKVNLKGVMIASGISDVNHSLPFFPDYFYVMGLIDFNERNKIKAEVFAIQLLIKAKMYPAALLAINVLINGNSSVSLKNLTGYSSVSNVLKDKTNNTERTNLLQYLEQPTTRSTIHAGKGKFEPQSQRVLEHFSADFFMSVAPWLVEVIDNYKVLVMNGQFDLTHPYTAADAMLRELKFSNNAQFYRTKRTPWFVGNNLVGYVKEYGNLTDVLFRFSGHDSYPKKPYFTIIQHFINNTPIEVSQ